MDVSPVQEPPGRVAPAAHRSEATVYELIRQDIVEGRLTTGSRLKISELGRRYGTSTNPVREALQQLRGEGFVLFSAQPRSVACAPIDDDFIRDIYEVTALLEPYMTRWFVDYASDEDIARLEAIQAEIEATGVRRSRCLQRARPAFSSRHVRPPLQSPRRRHVVAPSRDPARHRQRASRSAAPAGRRSCRSIAS